MNDTCRSASTRPASPLLAARCQAGARASTARAFTRIAHIGLDRALGCGLKYRRPLGDVHLGRR